MSSKVSIVLLVKLSLSLTIWQSGREDIVNEERKRESVQVCNDARVGLFDRERYFLVEWVNSTQPYKTGRSSFAQRCLQSSPKRQAKVSTRMESVWSGNMFKIKPVPEDIADLTNAIREKWQSDQARFLRRIDLTVYPAGTIVDSLGNGRVEQGEAYDPRDTVPVGQAPLLVVAPPAATQNEHEQAILHAIDRVSAPDTRDLWFNLSLALIGLETKNAPLNQGQLILQLYSLSLIANATKGVVVLETDCATKWRLAYFSSWLPYNSTNVARNVWQILHLFLNLALRRGKVYKLALSSSFRHWWRDLSAQ
jgi:hypothetical protein